MKPSPPLIREAENPDPHELHRPVPKVLLVIVAALLAWAVYYIVSDAPSLRSSSASQVEPSTPATRSPGS